MIHGKCKHISHKGAFGGPGALRSKPVQESWVRAASQHHGSGIYYQKGQHMPIRRWWVPGLPGVGHAGGDVCKSYSRLDSSGW